MKIICSILLVAGLVACGGPDKNLPGLNENAWKKDKNGCMNERSGMVDALQSSLDVIRGMSENEILHLLGQPDHNELYTRNQKFYIYYITPSLDCGTTGQERQLFLEIRFSATNMAREVTIKESGR